MKRTEWSHIAVPIQNSVNINMNILDRFYLLRTLTHICEMNSCCATQLVFFLQLTFSQFFFFVIVSGARNTISLPICINMRVECKRSYVCIKRRHSYKFKVSWKRITITLLRTKTSLGFAEQIKVSFVIWFLNVNTCPPSPFRVK